MIYESKSNIFGGCIHGFSDIMTQGRHIIQSGLILDSKQIALGYPARQQKRLEVLG